jgi:hypothetical protein
MANNVNLYIYATEPIAKVPLPSLDGREIRGG